MDKYTERYRIGKVPKVEVTRRSFLKGIGGLSVVLAAGTAPAFIREAGASKPRKVSFMLPWLFVGGHAFEFAARKIYWKKRGLDVSIARGYGSGAATKTVSAGKAMFAEASPNVMVTGVAKGLDVVVIAAKIQKSPIAISCRKELGIRKPKDLEGHHLVQWVASGDAVIWPGFVRATGIDASKVQVTNVHPSKLISTILNKQADCTGTYYVSNAPALALRTPAVHFLYADYGLQSLGPALMARSDTIKKEPKLVQDIVDGAMEGLKLQLLEPEKAMDIYIEAKPELKTKPRELLMTQLGNTNVLCFGQAVEKNGLGWMDPKDQKRTRDVVIKYMKPEKPPPPIEKLFTNRFAGNVKMTPAEWAKAKTWAAPYDPTKA
ncbi:MAG: ABC transporter substrate-binding protein [Nitrospinota bacterium]